MVDFNAFAYWYSETEKLEDAIEFFDNEIGENIRPYVCTEVELKITDKPDRYGMYYYTINGQLRLRAVENWFKVEPAISAKPSQWHLE